MDPDTVPDGMHAFVHASLVPLVQKAVRDASLRYFQRPNFQPDVDIVPARDDFVSRLPGLLAAPVNAWWRSLRSCVQAALPYAVQSADNHLNGMYSIGVHAIDSAELAQAANQLVFVGKAVTASQGAGVVCTENWTPPMADVHMIETQKAMIAAQKAVVAGSAHVTELLSLVSTQQMPHYAARVAQLRENLPTQAATLVCYLFIY